MAKTKVNPQSINPIKRSMFDSFLQNAINTKPIDDKKDKKNKENSKVKTVKKLKKQVG